MLSLFLFYFITKRIHAQKLKRSMNQNKVKFCENCKNDIGALKLCQNMTSYE